jgi:hypothetical protein
MKTKNKYKKVSIFMDNLQAHHSYEVKNTIRKLKWKVLYNAAYSSPYHCIEQVFAHVKRVYYKTMIEKDMTMSQR